MRSPTLVGTGSKLWSAAQAKKRSIYSCASPIYSGNPRIGLKPEWMIFEWLQCEKQSKNAARDSLGLWRSDVVACGMIVA